MKRKDYPIERGEVILALDFGGYTLDMALLKADGDGVLKQIKSESCEVLPGGTGKTITNMICACVYADGVFDDGVDRAKVPLFSKGEASGVHLKYKKCGESISLKYVESAREKIYDTVTVTEHRPNTADKSVSISVGEVYDRAAEIVSDFLDKCTDDDSKKITHLFFTGGTSRIARMRDHVIEEIKPWLAPNRNELHIDRYEDTKVLVRASSVDRDAYRWMSDARISLKAEYAVAYGAALVARNRSILKNGRMPRGDDSVKKAGMTKEQNDHLNRRRVELKRLINEIENSDIKTLDEVQKRLRALYEALGQFPRN